MKTKDRILEYTKEIIGSEGVDQVSGRRICSDLQINVSAIKYHFGDKDHLIAEALQMMTQDLDHVSLVLMDDSKPIKERVESFIVKILELVESQPDVVRHMLEGKGKFPVEKKHVMSNETLIHLLDGLEKAGYKYSSLEVRMKMLQTISALAYPGDLNLLRKFSEEDKKTYLKILLETWFGKDVS